MGSGRINLQQGIVRSPAFEADATGTVTLAPVLTNSALDIPVSVLLERSVAQKLNLAGNTSPNATYAKLPDFLTMKGTLGNSKPDTKYTVLVGVALQALSGAGGKNQGLLQGLGGLLGGSPPSNTNASPSTATNQPNQSPVGKLLNQFFKPKK